MPSQVTKRLLLPLLILGLLVAACGSATTITGGTGTIPGGNSTPGTTPSTGTNQVDSCPTMAVSSISCFTPHQLRVYYGTQALIDKGYSGKGQTVVDIVSFGSPTLQADMDIFDRQFNLPAIQVQVIAPLNVPEYDPNNDKTGWAGETELDVQIIHAIAPDANIVVLVSPVAETEGTIGLPEFRQLEQYAIDHHLGNIISQSWGASEATLSDAKGQAELQKWNTFFQNATTQQGISFFASSGDNGATDYADLQSTKLVDKPTTSFPTANPWVTSVGGTTMEQNGSNIHEIAWSDSGGGFSAFNALPAYQQTLPASTQGQFKQRRGVPDVSAAADPNTGMAFYFQGQWQTVGGTSAAAPVWAALLAIGDQMAGKPLGFINPGLYKLATAATYAHDFHDITDGNNNVNSKGVSVTGFPAVAGWDAVTGLGTPNAETLLPDLIQALKA